MKAVPSGPRFFSRRAGRWLSLPGANLAEQDQPIPALDQRFRVPGSTRVVTMRALFGALRQAGVRPHSGDPADDDEVAERLVRLCRDVLDGRRARGVSTLNLGEPEADPEPSGWFGVAEPACPWGDDDQGNGVWGRYDQIVGDLRDMGCGAIRRFKYRDVYWGSIFRESGPAPEYFKGGMVLPPAEILEALRQDDFAVLAQFTELVVACLLAGIKMAITPFDSGGGSSFNVATKEKAAARDLADPLAGGRTWVEVFENRPAWQTGVRVPSTEGWDEFYWRHGLPADEEEVFERFAIHVWPTRESDPVSSTSYGRECARRKSLGIAAFCQGIAEHLAALDDALVHLLGNEGVTSVVTHVELGNELNGLFQVPDGDASDGLVAAGQLEAGRYMVLLAQPFRHLLPSMEFRASELSSWHPSPVSGACVPEAGCCVTDTFDERVTWLRDTIGEGVTMAHGVEVLNQYSIAVLLATGGAVLLSEDSIEWAWTSIEAGYAWPPFVIEPGEALSFRATSLVHQVGLHWFHGYDRDAAGAKAIPKYQDAIRIKADLDLLGSVVVEELATSHGFGLSTTAGAVAFPAVFPRDIDLGSVEAPYYDQTNALLQAGMLARYLCLFQAAGVQRMSWFCPYLKPMPGGADRSPDQWNKESVGTGLHNDVYREGEYLDFAAEGAWRRPAWFTYRRVSWLLSLVDGPGLIVENSEGRTVIRFRLRARMSSRPHGSLGYRYLWIAWVDQYADSECLHGAYRLFTTDVPSGVVGSGEMSLWLYDTTGSGYELVSLVPSLTEHVRIGETDDNGYRQVSERDWTWAGWDGAVLDHGETAFGPGRAMLSWFFIQKCAPSVAQAPVAILSDAEEAWVS